MTASVRAPPTRCPFPTALAAYRRVVPADVVMKAMNAVHRAVLTLSRGRIGYQGEGMPVLELATVGRRSGRPRSVLLTSPAREGDTLVVIASRGGDDRHPDWLLNLRAQPRCEVSLQGGPRRPMVARIVDGPERDRLWRRITTTNPRYAAYQRRTSREIPVVLLAPAPDR
jgi:deazaflavin-dependent oxidoreductase (nitroreductase family)